MIQFLYYNLSAISLALYALILLITGWLFYSKKISVAAVQIFILTVVAFLVLKAGFGTFLQYYAFKAGTPGVYLLPPYQPITYFASYVWLHFWAVPVFAIAASFLFGFAAWVLNYFGGKQFFEKEELLLLILGGLVSGWPNFLLYLGLIVVLMIAANTVNAAFYHDSRYRLPSGVFIIAAAFITVFLGDFIAPYVGIEQFKI